MKFKLTLLMCLAFTINQGFCQTEDHPPDEGDIPTQQEYAQALVNALGTAGPRLQQMIGALSAYCGTQEFFNSGMGGNCDLLYFEALEGNRFAVLKVLRKLRPREVVQSARTSSQIIANQQANLASRMAQVRAGVNTIAFTVNGQELPMSVLSYLADGDSGFNRLASPWGFFVNGQFSKGDYAYSDAGNEGFDFDSNGFTAGIDYRFNSKAVAGVAVGYSSFDSTVGTDITMESTSLTYSLYASYNFNENFYMDARLSHGSPDFDQVRSIDFTLGGNTTNLTANGTTDGTQDSYIVSAGYQFNSNNGWQFTPSLSYEYNKTQIDAFVETNAAAFNVGFSEQNFKTDRYTLGFQASKSISMNNGVLIPTFSYELINESQNTDVVLMRISGMPAGEFFESAVNFNDGNYSNARIGLTYVSSHGKQAYIQYSKVFGWEGFSRYGISLGARFEF